MANQSKIPVLSVRQPFAWLIVNGHKDIENRTWPTSYRGPLLIHTGLQMFKEFDDSYLPSKDIDIPLKFDLQFGGIIGIVDVIDCVSKSKSPWFFGPYGLVLANARVLPYHPCKGSLKMFFPDLPADYLEGIV